MVTYMHRVMKKITQWAYGAKRRIDMDARSSRRIDVDATSLLRQVPTVLGWLGKI